MELKKKNEKKRKRETEKIRTKKSTLKDCQLTMTNNFRHV